MKPSAFGHEQRLGTAPGSGVREQSVARSAVGGNCLLQVLQRGRQPRCRGTDGGQGCSVRVLGGGVDACLQGRGCGGNRSGLGLILSAGVADQLVHLLLGCGRGSLQSGQGLSVLGEVSDGGPCLLQGGQVSAEDRRGLATRGRGGRAARGRGRRVASARRRVRTPTGSQGQDQQQ